MCMIAPIASVCVLNDTQPWTPRFNVKDNVVCDANGSFRPRIVKKVWTGPVKDKLPVYKCSVKEGAKTKSCFIYEDTDGAILPAKFKNNFRFSEGDSVIFSSNLARGLTNRRRDPWIKGKVYTDLFVDEGLDYCAAYTCTFVEQRKVRTCHIVEDDDEHIACTETSFRERLMCSLESQ